MPVYPTFAAKSVVALSGFILALLCSACSGKGTAPDIIEPLAVPGSINLPKSEAFIELPEDRRRSWEQLDSDGYVIPATDSSWLTAPAAASLRGGSGINADSEFIAGAQFDSIQGQVTTEGLAVKLQSGPDEHSVAFYRLPLQGLQPGVLSVDVNLSLNSETGRLSQCWVGVAEFGRRAWEWRLASESHTRFSLAAQVAQGADYTNGLGNMQLAVVAADGAELDLIGIGVNPLVPADAVAPPQPGGLSATPVAGGLELQWNSVLASDLAGYRIYYRKADFSTATENGVQQAPYLQGATRHLLSGLSGNTFVRISAVDVSGNESPLSASASAAALMGSAPGLEVSTSISSGRFGDNATLSASGASLYDIDADGDGVFEITGSASGTASIDTNQTGIIRPAVRGSSGSAVAHGAVSLIIASNLPPVAQLIATPNSAVRWPGDANFTPELDAGATTDEDPSSLMFAFDPEGDGSFGTSQSASEFAATYSQGIFLASVRVTDSGGLVAYDDALVTVKRATDWSSSNLTHDDPGATDFLAGLSCAIVAGSPAVAFTISGQGVFYARASDPEGRVWPEPFVLVEDELIGSNTSLAIINGNPAVAFRSVLDVKYIRSTTASGNTLSAWSNPPVVAANDMNIFPGGMSVAEVAGRPAIAFRDGGINFDAFYVRATAGSGDLQSDWTNEHVLVNVGSGTTGLHNIDLRIIAGNPAVAFASGTELLYERCTTTTGDSAGDWAVSAFDLSDDGSATEDSGFSLAIISGNPAVAYFDRSDQPYGLRYRRATNSSGATPADWAPSVLLDEGEGTQFVGEYCTLAAVNDRPAVSYRRTTDSGSTLFFIRAANSSGTLWGSRQRADGYIGEFPGYESKLVFNSGWAGIAHYDGSGDSNLLFFSSVNLH